MPTNPTRPSVLVVDDDDNILNLIRHALEEAGMSVVTENDGFAALVVIDNRPPSLIIADVMMPRLNGLDLLKATRNRPETARIPFIIVSAMDKAESVQKGLELGANDYITKPFKVSEIVGKVRHFLRNGPRAA